MTPAQQDACANWWYGVLTDIKRQMAAEQKAGGDGWSDLQAKLAIVRMYDEAVDIERHILGRVVQRLALAYADRPGWVDAWRP